jgi:hypothetical protein
MFSNTYKDVQDNKKSIPLRRILHIKNILGYDQMIGSVSSSFFPMNIVILPFIPIIISVRNRNTNETFNKMQYSFLVMLYSVIFVAFQIVLAPIMMVKLAFNTLHLMFT